MTGGTRSGGETGSVSIKSHLLRRGQDSTPETPEKRDRASIRNSRRDQIGSERLFAAHPSFSWDELTESGTRIRRPTRGSNEKTGDGEYSAVRASSSRNGFRHRKSGRNRHNRRGKLRFEIQQYLARLQVRCFTATRWRDRADGVGVKLLPRRDSEPRQANSSNCEDLKWRHSVAAISSEPRLRDWRGVT